MSSDALVDEKQYPSQPLDLVWSADALANGVDVLLRYHRAMRKGDDAIALEDEMWNGLGKDMPEYARLHYMYGGRSALKCVVDALLAAEAPAPRRVLDFPSGHGRALRFFKAAFPESELWAGDLNRAGVDFCAQRFGAKPFYSDPDLSAVVFPGKFDLIWCGSLASHLPEEQAKRLFALLIGALEENGILCITTCGRGMRYAHENIFRTIDDEGYQRICDQLKERPFGYSPYRHRYDGYDREEKYGMAFIYPAWIQEHVLTPDIQVLHMREKAWHGAQDVWCLINRPLSSWYHWAKS